jgi:hypothetical protein
VQQALKACTANERAELEERRNALRRRLNIWMEARNLYIPTVSDDDHTATSSTESPLATLASQLPETIPLRLPSALPSSLQKPSPFKLVQIEFRFRLAQAEDSLSELRRLLRITMGLRDYKSKQIGPSQRAGTRARNLMNRFNDKVSRCAERYRVAYSSLVALDPMGKWRALLWELKEGDIKAPGRSDNESEGFHEVPWIWKATLPVQRHAEEQVSSSEQLGPLSDEDLDGCEHMYQYYPI